MSRRRPTVAIAHPGLGSGGSEARALWGITALKDTYDVTLLTGRSVELDRLNRHCGTSLKPDDFHVLMPNQRVMRLLGRTDALRGSLFGRFCRSVAHRFDVCISAYNFIDFGRPAIQFVADFCFDDALRREFDVGPPGARRWAHRPGMLRKAYLRLAAAISGSSGRSPLEDTIVANSCWTAGVLRERRGMAIDRVLYPPVVGESTSIPWTQREAGFVCLGRVSHEKRIEQIIEILRCVRAKGHDVHLHLIGPIGGDDYGRMIRRLCDEHRDWVLPEGCRIGEEKMALLARHRFAIHACPREAFGIAVAEMVKAGCIPFVPAGSAPAEIVDHSALTYTSVDDAVLKIDSVLRNDAEQQTLRGHLANRGTQFSAEQFMAGLRKIIEGFLRTRACSRPNVLA